LDDETVASKGELVDHGGNGGLNGSDVHLFRLMSF